MSATPEAPHSLFAELQRRNVVRVAALYLIAGWIVLQVADLLFEIAGVPQWAAKLVLILLTLGFPLALIFAWIYELTPEGLKKQHEVDRNQSIVRETGRKLNVTIGVLAVIAIVGMIVDRLVPRSAHEAIGPPVAATAESLTESAAIPASPPSMPSMHSIAVLPFADMSQQHDQEYFADGLSEELLNLLAQIDGLKVIGRTSSFQFKGRNEDLRTIGEQLGVANLLEGSVRKSGDKLRVTAQLIRASDGTHLWSETYDRKLDDVFAMQDDIAAAVVDKLRLQLLEGTTPVRAPRHDTESYNLYLEGRFYIEQRTDESVGKAIALFRNAVERDPDFALAWVGLSLAYAFEAGSTILIQPDEGFRLARQAAERALAIDPEQALAHLALARVQANHDWDWAGADASVRRAYALAPADVDVMAGTASQDVNMGRFAAGAELLQRAIDRDPLRAVLYNNLSFALIALGRYAEGEQAASRCLELAPASGGYPSQTIVTMVVQGKFEEARTFLARESSPIWRDYATALVAWGSGDRAESNAALDGVKTVSEFAAYQIAEVYAYRGETDRAFEWLERAYRQRDSGISQILSSPFLTPLAADPRYAAFLAKVGLPNPYAR